MASPAVAWFEVTGKDGAALQQFYGGLFDWEVTDSGDDSGYGLVPAAENGIGGGIGASQDGGPGQVTFYVEVDDPSAYLQKAEQLGGTTIMLPPRSPVSGSRSRSSPIQKATSSGCRTGRCSERRSRLRPGRDRSRPRRRPNSADDHRRVHPRASRQGPDLHGRRVAQDRQL